MVMEPTFHQISSSFAHQIYNVSYIFVPYRRNLHHLYVPYHSSSHDTNTTHAPQSAMIADAPGISLKIRFSGDLLIWSQHITHCKQLVLRQRFGKRFKMKARQGLLGPTFGTIEYGR